MVSVAGTACMSEGICIDIVEIETKHADRERQEREKMNKSTVTF